MKKGSPQVEPRTAQPERIPNRKPSVKTLLKPYPVNESKVGAVIRRGSNFHSSKQTIPLQLGIYENLFVYSLFLEILQECLVNLLATCHTPKFFISPTLGTP